MNLWDKVSDRVSKKVSSYGAKDRGSNGREKKRTTSTGNRGIDRGTKASWKDEFYLRSYLLAKEGKTDSGISRVLGVSRVCFGMWLDKKPALREALAQARNGSSGAKEFMNYVYGRLPLELRDVWDEIEQGEEGATRDDRMEGFFLKEGKRARQHLFLHALVSSDFNPSHACRKLGLSHTELESWKKEVDFAAILEQFHEHKKNFFESSLIRLVRSGDSSATIFANRTINKDRGYGEKSGPEAGSVTNNFVNIEELNLPLDVRKVILEALRKKEAPQLEHREVQDAEFTVKKKEMA